MSRHQMSKKGEPGAVVEPLIPSHIIDVASQKAYFIAIFLLIQAWKVQQCVLLKTQGAGNETMEYDQFAFILKFFIIDSLYLWILPVFRIPLLTFNPFITFLQSIIVTAFTIFLSCDLSMFFSSMFYSTLGLFKIKKSVKHSNVDIGSKFQEDMDIYFKGKKTINILPKSTSYLNPFAENYCLDTTGSVPTLDKSISIPIKFNSSNEIASIEVVYTDYNNQKHTTMYQKKQLKSLKISDKHKFINYLKKDLIINGHLFINNDIDYTVNKLDKSRISFIELPVDKPGLYSVGKVFDSKNLPVKVHQSNVIVSKCPNAELVENPGTMETYAKCVGDYNNLKIKIHGVPPLRVKYIKYINAKREIVDEKLLQPYGATGSPLVSVSVLESQRQFSVSRLTTEQLASFHSWSDSYTVELNVSDIVDQTGDYSYSLAEVEDGFGNLVNLTRIYQNEYQYKQKHTSLEEYLKSKHLFQTYKAYGSPKLKLIDTVPNKPLIENETRDLQLVINGKHNLHDLATYEPIYANISFIANDENVFESQPVAKKRKVIENFEFNSQNKFRFTAERSGSYKLESVDLKYCPGLIDDNNKRIDIFKAFKPYLSVLSVASINDTCLGQIGLSFDLLLTGIPPFEVKVNNYQLEGHSKKLIGTKKLKIPSSNRFQYNYEPQNEGDYEIELSAIHDNIYRNFIDLDGKYKYRTSMRAKPDATFLNVFSQRHHEKTLCLGSENEILPIRLNGEAPFELTYSIVEKATNRRKTYSSKSAGNQYNLRLPVFTKGGHYVVSLTSVKDKSNCVVLLDGQDVSINVKKELPYAEFEPILGSALVNQKGYKINIKEGQTVSLPVKLVGEKNIKVGYRVEDAHGKQNQLQTFNNPHGDSVFHSKITVSKAGVYYLTEIKDNTCIGLVNEKLFYNVTYHTKPELIINQSANSRVKSLGDGYFKKQEICVNENHNIVDLVLKGKPPFLIDYIVELPNGIRKMKNIKVLSNFIFISILGDLSPEEKTKGTYRYIFKSVSDAIYSKADLRNFREEQVIEQKVLEIPNGRLQYGVRHKTHHGESRHIDNKRVLQTCSHNLLGNENILNQQSNKLKPHLQPLELHLQGAAPYKVELEIYNENFNKFNTLILEDLQNKVVHLDERIAEYLSLGNHFITIKKIVDGHGCVKDDFPHQQQELNSITAKTASTILLNHQVMISITDVPKISKILGSGSDICIGDTVGYKLHGTGPFVVEYQFNGKLNTVVVKDTTEFKRRLVQPGVFEIVSIADGLGCKVNVKEDKQYSQKDLRVTIHDKPSVEIINANEENIQEGDEVEIVFKFTGTGPFSLIYRRVFNDLKDFEIYHVNNIQDNEYYIKTSLQGSYDAIEIKDAFCEARRNI